MSYLSKAQDISQLPGSNLWVIYGKSTSGKTELLSTFPKPLLYVRIGDDGSNTIAGKKGIKALAPDNLTELREIAQELKKDTKYAAVGVDTFGLVVNEWIDQNAVQKKKRVTQQMWGDLKTDTEELIKLFHLIARNKIVVLTCHEVADSIEGYEDEISPDIRPNVSRGARTYLEGMANFGIHTTVIEKEKEKPDGSIVTITRHAAHLATNPYYWVKTQKPANIKLPKLVYNPTYDKIMKLMKGEK